MKVAVFKVLEAAHGIVYMGEERSNDPIIQLEIVAWWKVGTNSRVAAGFTRIECKVCLVVVPMLIHHTESGEYIGLIAANPTRYSSGRVELACSKCVDGAMLGR